jgi:hypothetical protein
MLLNNHRRSASARTRRDAPQEAHQWRAHAAVGNSGHAHLDPVGAAAVATGVRDLTLYGAVAPHIAVHVQAVRTLAPPDKSDHILRPKSVFAKITSRV